MNTQKSVFNKISKIAPQEVELSEVQRVEFALVDDAKKLINEGKNALKLTNDIESASKEAIKEYDSLKGRIEKVKNNLESVIKLESLLDKAAIEFKKSDKILNDFNQQAKELGISPSSVKEYDELFDLVFKFSEDSTKVRKLIRDIKMINSELK